MKPKQQLREVELVHKGHVFVATVHQNTLVDIFKLHPMEEDFVDELTDDEYYEVSPLFAELGIYLGN